MGFFHVLTKPQDSPKKITLTLVEMQQLPDIEKTHSTNEICCLKWTIYNGRRKVCVYYQTVRDDLNFVVYRYRNNLYVKDSEMDLKITDYEKLFSKQVYALSYVDVSFKQFLRLYETFTHNSKKLRQEWMFFFQ